MFSWDWWLRSQYSLQYTSAVNGSPEKASWEGGDWLPCSLDFEVRILPLFVIVFGYARVRVCGCMCTCMHIHVEARSQHQVVPQEPPTLVFETEILARTWNSQSS